VSRSRVQKGMAALQECDRDGSARDRGMSTLAVRIDAGIQRRVARWSARVAKQAAGRAVKHLVGVAAFRVPLDDRYGL
jgi:hypothetical protein